jgi:glutaredoxin
MRKIILYTTPGCRLCDRVRQLLRARNAPFEEVDVRQDPVAFHQLTVLAGGPFVPTIEVDGEVLVGLDEERLDELASIAVAVEEGEARDDVNVI